MRAQKFHVRLERDEQPKSPPSRIERATKVATFVSAVSLATFGTCTLGKTIDKFAAETQRAALEAQKTRIEVAAKGRDSALLLSANELSGKGRGWYTVNASLQFTNAGIQTIVVDHVRFSCGWSSLDAVWSETLRADGGARATWISSSSTGLGLTWVPLGPVVTYPMNSGGSFDHRSNFQDGVFAHLNAEYQPNGAGIYMSGESLTASHQLVARFARASALRCLAEIEYRTTDGSRTEMQAAKSRQNEPGMSVPYVLPYVSTSLPVCGEEDWASCKAFTPVVPPPVQAFSVDLKVQAPSTPVLDAGTVTVFGTH